MELNERYELYQLLEALGAEVTDENADILTEGIFKSIGKFIGQRRAADTAWHYNNRANAVEKLNRKREKLNAKGKNTSEIDTQIANTQDKLRNSADKLRGLKYGGSALSKYTNNRKSADKAITDYSASYVTSRENDASNQQLAEPVKSNYQIKKEEKKAAKASATTSAAPEANTNPDNNTASSEATQNQTVTTESLVLHVGNITLTEGIAEDYIYMQLLDKNGFAVTESNLNVLKEAFDNGHIELVD